MAGDSVGLAGVWVAEAPKPKALRKSDTAAAICCRTAGTAARAGVTAMINPAVDAATGPADTAAGPRAVATYEVTLREDGGAVIVSGAFGDAVASRLAFVESAVIAARAGVRVEGLDGRSI